MLAPRFGRALDIARQTAGLSVAELMRRADLARTLYYRIVQGDVNLTLGTLERLASVVGVPLARLLDTSEDMDSSIQEKPGKPSTSS